MSREIFETRCSWPIDTFAILYSSPDASRHIRDPSIGRVASCEGGNPLLMIVLDRDSRPCSFSATPTTPAFRFLSRLVSSRPERTTHVVRRSGGGRFRARLFAASVIEPVSSDYRLNELREPGEKERTVEGGEAIAPLRLTSDPESKFFSYFLYISIFQI